MRRFCIMFSLMILILMLASCKIDSWAMDNKLEEQFSSQFREFINNTVFDAELNSEAFNEDVYDKLVFLFNDDNFDTYILSVKGRETDSSNEITYNFRKSAIYDNEVFEEGTTLYLHVSFRLEGYIESITFNIYNENSTESFYIDYTQILLHDLNQKDIWSCDKNQCFLTETKEGFSTMYDPSEYQFEIKVTDPDGVEQTTLYYSFDNYPRVSSNTDSSPKQCDLTDLESYGFSIEQIEYIESSILVIDGLGYPKE